MEYKNWSPLPPLHTHRGALCCMFGRWLIASKPLKRRKQKKNTHTMRLLSSITFIYVQWICASVLYIWRLHSCGRWCCCCIIIQQFYLCMVLFIRNFRKIRLNSANFTFDIYCGLLHPHTHTSALPAFFPFCCSCVNSCCDFVSDSLNVNNE